jgi:hypothetical protein
MHTLADYNKIVKMSAGLGKKKDDDFEVDSFEIESLESQIQ